MMVYAVGIVSYMGFYHGVTAVAGPLWRTFVASVGITVASATVFGGVLSLNYILAKKELSWHPGNRVFRTWFLEAKQEWH